MVITRTNFSRLQLRTTLAEHCRPFFWVGLLCATYGYIPYVMYDVPVLYYLGLCMMVASLGLRACAGPLIAALTSIEQVRTGGLPWRVLLKRIALLLALITASVGGTALLVQCFSRLAQ